jgi:hypothetical protein
MLSVPCCPAGDIEASQKGVALFVPTNEAVSRAGWEADTSRVTHTLLYHIVPAAQQVTRASGRCH